MFSPSVADRDADGQIEFFGGPSKRVAGPNLYRMFGYNEDTSKVENWPKDRVLKENSLILDIDSDQSPEIISYYENKIYAYSLEGNILDGFPKLLDGDTIKGIGVDDLNNDGNIEMYAFISGATNKGYDNLIYLWQLGKINKESEHWPKYLHDPQHTGCYKCDENYLCGDADGDGIVNIADVTYLIQYIFVDGSPAPSPLLAGDADNNAVVQISDAVYLIQYIFNGGPAPCEVPRSWNAGNYNGMSEEEVNLYLQQKQNPVEQPVKKTPSRALV